MAQMCDRPEKDIVVTPAMKAAGVTALEEYAASYDAWALVEVVYNAMKMAEQGSEGRRGGR